MEGIGAGISRSGGGRDWCWYKQGCGLEGLGVSTGIERCGVDQV